MSARLLAIVAFVVLFLAGCATVRDDAVKVLNASSAFATSAEPALEQLYKRELEDCVSAPTSREDGAACVAGVRARYKPGIAAYRDYRAAWLVEAAQIRAYDDAVATKATANVATVGAGAAALVASEGALVDAFTKIRQTTPTGGGK